MNGDQIQPVLIAGAGPTGMTAAMELSRMGIPVRIIDKATGPSSTSRALAVQSRTVELMEQRGLSEELLEKGNRAKATTIYSEEKILGKVNLNLIPSRYNFCLLIPQSDTETILRKQLEKQNVFIEWQTEMIDFIQLPNGGGIIVQIKGPENPVETFSASYLISAEGAHSIARTKLGIEFAGKTMGQNYALGDLHIKGDIPEDELSIFLGKKGFLAVFPLTGQRFRLMVTDPQAIDKNQAPPSLEYLQELYDSVSHIPAKLYNPHWTSRFGINSRMVHVLKTGCVFLGGDSAHIHSPAGGQGMNTGIQDMINLCWKLAFVIKGMAKPELLDTYQEERIPVMEQLLSKTEKATDAFNSTNPVIQGLMKIFLPPVLSFGFVQQKGAEMISEVAHTYHGTALAGMGSAVGSLKAGDRIPNWDLEVTAVSSNGNDKRCTTIYQLLDPSSLTLLLINGTGKSSGDHIYHPMLNTWNISSGDARFSKIFGIAPAFILVRPDAYIGISGHYDQIKLIGKWLKLVSF